MKKTLHINGMHCVSCEVILEKNLKKIKGVHSCKISHKKGYAEIECDEDVTVSKLENVIRESGYEVSENKKPDHIKPDYFQILLIAIFLGALLFVLKKFDIARLFPDYGDKAGVAIAFLIGIAASLSTCLALVGGIVMGFGAMVNVENGEKNRFLSRSMPHIYFHIGRVGGFILLGGILGLIGSKINYSLTFTGYLTIIISFVMLYIGLQILNIVPNITKLGFHLPKSFSGGIDKLEKSDHHMAPVLIGLLTFFLPCGFTQSMQLAAVASGSFISGALIMGAFALGTLPVLFAVGVGSTYAKKGKMKIVSAFIGALIVFFAIYSFNSGLVLTGAPFNLSFWNSGNGGAVSDVKDDVQVIKMDVDWVFEPTEFTVKKGIPVRWEINGINLSGCSNQVVIPRLNIRKPIQKGLNVIEFTPTDEGVLQFSCAMGMLRGQITVTD
jgi:uncharacterized protein